MTLVHSETSTGVVADVEALAAAAKEAGALVVVDAISSLGAVPLETDAWGLDVVVTGSQKALMTPPGLALVAVSDAAYAAAARRRAALLLRLGAHAEGAGGGRRRRSRRPCRSSRASTSRSGSLLEDGLDAAFARHARLGRACRAGAKAMGLELFSPDDDRSAVVTAIRTPDGVDSDELLLLLRDRHGVTLAPGQGELKGKAFRIGHIGWFDVFDIAAALSAVELALTELGRADRARRRRGRRVRGVRELRRRVRVLVREAIAEAGVELLRSRFDVDVDSRVAARGDHRPVRRDRHPVGDEGRRRA